jgi:alanyl aminopeptidase
MNNARVSRTVCAWVLVLTLIPLVTASAKDIRLDPRVAATFEAIELNLDANKTDYTGSVTIEFRVEKATSEFRFHAEEMSLDRIELSGKDGSYDVSCEIGDDGLAVATASRQLVPGNYTMKIDFSKEYNTQAVGLYRMEYEEQGYLFTQFEAVDARKAFPCWDEPIFKIPFQMTIHIPDGQDAVTNTPVESRESKDGMQTIKFRETKPLPTYLLAIAAGPLESVEITGLSVPGRIYTVKGQKHMAGLAVEYSPPILEALEAYFGSEYPYAKLDLIAVPEYWAGAMENAGAVTFRDQILLIDPDAASVGQKRTLAAVIAHEFAHMWFGDLVTMSWWEDLWLNESFADWMGDKITQQLYPQFEIEVAAAQGVQGLMNMDARPSTKPIRRPVESTDEIWEDAGLAYGKGNTVLRMIEEWIGHDTFREGVIDYIEANRWGNTVASDLWTALSQVSGKNLEPILASFLDQSGCPIITLDVESGGMITLTQERFLNHGVEAPAQLWTVPVRVKYNDGTNTLTRTVVLKDESTSFEVGTNVEWAMPNAGAYGYYRWTAPPEMMAKMAADPEETMDQRERATFLGNTRALLAAGEMSGADYLTILGSFAKTPQPEIVTAVLNDLGSIEMAFVTDDLTDAFAHYVRSMVGPSLDRYGIDKRDGETEAVTLLRPRLLNWLGDEGQVPKVKQHCEKLAKQYLADPNSIDASLAAVALRVSAIDGDREMFETYKQRFEASQVPADRARYLYALGSFSDEALQDDALAYIFAGTIRPTEIFNIVGGIGNTAAGREKAYKWMTDNYDEITSRIPAPYAAYMPYFARGCSSERLAAARQFFSEPEHNVDGTDNQLAKAADQVVDCVNLREREGEAVADYLNGLLASQ